MKTQIKKLLREEIKRNLMSEAFDKNKTYTDPWNNEEHSGEKVSKYIYAYRNVRMKKDVRQSYVNFFARIGLQSEDYKKPKNVNILQLKKVYSGEYFAEGVIDGYEVRVEFERNGPKGWCWEWKVNGVGGNMDCTDGGLKDFKENLDNYARTAIDMFNESY